MLISVPLAFYLICLLTAAITVTEVSVNVPLSGDHVIPVVLQLQDDKRVESKDFYQLTIVNVSDSRAVAAGDVSTSYIIVNDDDGKL